MSNNPTNWLKLISEVQAIAQNGLAYCHNEFDKERYTRLREIAAELTVEFTEHEREEIQLRFTLEHGYATPKLEIRAFVLKENKILLVKERSDGLWTLPGGWTDINESPSEAVIRETREETGFNVSAVRLLALWDEQKHDHPHHWPHTYKCFFHCDLISGEATENIEISAIDFFDLNDLPPLSTPRVTQRQLMRLYEQVTRAEQTLFD
ncbi:NUDIX hydrolase [Legionella lytica]|uniref:NUDIX hydrolase n=1 Tax=Legionella lytica TaxID=96232 RepID=A0ABY4Y8Z3_9GAMM|nr:NUDIX hydrolase [Legionella lytica]USQ14050.1 NUDIX hydrolase [Legionella lytica]